MEINLLNSIEEAERHYFGGDWTLIKLDALEQYLLAYKNVLKDKNFKLIYIDGFAGTGRCDTNSGIVPGSAVRALDIGFNEYHFIDTGTKQIKSLELLKNDRQNDKIFIHQNDTNVAIKNIVAQIDWKKSRAVLFLDPFGMHVEWSTLEIIAKTKAIDLWYLFPFSGLTRQASRRAEALDQSKIKSITKILGTDKWMDDFYEKNKQSDLFDEPREIRTATSSEMLDFFTERLRTIFPNVANPVVLNNSKKSALFALYFAVANPNKKAYDVALRIANHILKGASDG